MAFSSIGLHLHDTRGCGVANAYAGLQVGVDQFDSSCAGLGGCPFAGHRGAAGNVCTEDLVFMCEEMGISTGVDLERMVECAQLAEEIFGATPRKAYARRNSRQVPSGRFEARRVKNMLAGSRCLRMRRLTDHIHRAINKRPFVSQ